MAKPRGSDTKTWTASQVVAHNLTRAPRAAWPHAGRGGRTVGEVHGLAVSQATVAQAEGSVAGHRVREFTANELLALARVFDLPVLYFFLPPDDGPKGFGTADAPARGWPWEYLLLLVWGHRRNFPAVADRAAPWAHASAVVTVPRDDALDGTPDADLLGQLQRPRALHTGGHARGRLQRTSPAPHQRRDAARRGGRGAGGQLARTGRRSHRLRQLPTRNVPRPRRGARRGHPRRQHGG